MSGKRERIAALVKQLAQGATSLRVAALDAYRVTVVRATRGGRSFGKSLATVARSCRPARGDRLAVLVVSAVCLALMAEALFTQRIFFQGDLAALTYPRAVGFARTIAERTLPLWDPYPAFGRPRLADPTYQVVYPWTWAQLALPAGLHHKVGTFVHLCIAGIGLALLCRRWRLSPLAAGVGGALWVCSGPLLSLVKVHHFAAAAYLPWALLSVREALAGRTRRGAALLAGALTAMVLAGSSDVLAFAGVLGLALVLVEHRRWRRRPLGLVALAVGAGFGAGLSAIQWVPTLELLSDATRGHYSAAETSFWSLHPLSLLDGFFPRLIASLPLAEDWRARLFEGREPFLGSLHLGIAAVPLAILGLRATRRRLVAYAAAALTLCILLALGRHTWMHGMLQPVPLLGWLRYPVKWAVPAALAWALLCALGFDAWCRARRCARPLQSRMASIVGYSLGFAGLAAAAALLVAPGIVKELLSSEISAAQRHGVVLAMAGKLAASGALCCLTTALVSWRRGTEIRCLAPILALLVVGEGVVAGRTVNPLAHAELLSHRPPILQALDPDREDYRICSSVSRTPLWNQLVRGPIGWQPEEAWALGLADALRPERGARWGLHGSYDPDVSGLAPETQSNLSWLLFRHWGQPIAGKMLAMANVRYVVGVGGEENDTLRLVREEPSVFREPVRLFRVNSPVPRAYVVDRAHIAQGVQAGLLLASEGFDIYRDVILNEGATPSAGRSGFSGRSRVTCRQADRLEVETDQNGPGWLIVVDTFDRGWKARVDGRSSPVLRANLLFRAVAVPEGRHVVELVYRPEAVIWGLAISLATAFLVAGLASFAYVTRNRCCRPGAGGGL